MAHIGRKVARKRSGKSSGKWQVSPTRTTEGTYRCPVREGLPTNPLCLAELHVYGKRFYTVNPVTGALQKSESQLYDVVCDKAHVLIEDATNVNSALRHVLDLDQPRAIDSADFNARLTALINAAVAHDSIGVAEAAEGLKHFLRRSEAA